jgi:hypothetical protein
MCGILIYLKFKNNETKGEIEKDVFFNIIIL